LLEGGSVGRAVFVFGGFYFLAGFVGRNNPIKSAVFGHGAEEKVCVAGKDGESGTEKVSGGGGIGFLRFAFLDLFHHFINVRVGRAYTGDARRILLNQAKERDIRKIGGDADFNNGFRLMFFRRVKLRETRPEDVSLQIISARGDGILFHAKLHEPDFRSIIPWSVADQDDLEERFVGFHLDRAVELRNEGTQFFEEGNADLLEILLGGAFRNSVGINRAKVRDVAVEPDGPGLRGDLPFGRAKEKTDVAAVNGSNARGNGFGFERMIDGRENDGAIGNVDDGAATGEVGDDFLFLRAKSFAGQEQSQQKQGGVNQEVLHGGRVAQRADWRLGAAPRTFPERGRIR